MITDVAIHTLGCKSNQYDSSAIESALLSSGFKLVPFPSLAHAYIINTCTVTDRTDSRSRQAIRKARRLNPDATVIVTGCYAQVSPGEIEGLDAADFILGNPDKDRVLECLKRGRPAAMARRVSDFAIGAPLAMRAVTANGRARANVKIQDGCERFCSYCIIPFARGKSKSLSLDAIEAEVELLIKKGFVEIVFTGIHLGAWGEDLLPRTNLAALVKRLEGLSCRFRISSIDPDEITDELISLVASSRSICNHLHLPLQSGDDKILKLMNRPYTAADFKSTVLKLATSVPDINIGTDVIVGFPGESDEAFENTFKLIESLPIGYMHVFPYSARKGTPAAAMPQKPSPSAVRERAERLKTLDRVKREAFQKRFIDHKAKILVENERDRSKRLTGKTRNYIQVMISNTKAPEFDSLKGKEVEVTLTGLTTDGLEARLDGNRRA